MGIVDKVSNKIDELKGKVKQQHGDAVDDPELQAEGRVDEAKADLKQAVEKTKDAFRE